MVASNITYEPYLPQCTSGRLDGEFDSEAAATFDPISWNYYKVNTAYICPPTLYHSCA